MDRIFRGPERKIHVSPRADGADGAHRSRGDSESSTGHAFAEEFASVREPGRLDAALAEVFVGLTG